MPFTSRDKPRLVERLRGKTGQDLFNQVKSALNSDSRRMLFNNSPTSWSGRDFPRGFPFDDEDPPSFASRRLRPFDDRPADFSGASDDIQEPPFWDENGPKRRTVDPEDAQPPQPQAKEKPSPLSHHGLRNTVPLAQTHQSERPARAMSAPPGGRPQRFTSTCEIPVNAGADHPPQPSQQQQQPPGQPSNVRVIPITVEGRDEPLINSNIDTSANFAGSPPTGFDARMPRDFGNFRKQSTRFAQSPPQAQAQKPPAPPKQPQPKPQQVPEPKSSDETDRPSQPAPPPDPTTLALNRIAMVQQEVENLGKQVEAATITSRKDKAYMYLDEMLTRQLLHLDNIDPEGRDNVRQARKDAIRAIQKCISFLESKAPAEPMEVEATEQTAEDSEPMATESSQEPPVTENNSAANPTPPSDPSAQQT